MKMNKQRRILFAILIVLFLVSLYQSIELIGHHPDRYSELNNNSNSSITKTILIWNAHSRFELDVFGQGRQPFVDNGCRVSDCFITKNRSWAALHQFDAVIFNMPPLSIHKLPVDRHRRADQRYIFFSQEPPTYIGEEVDKFNHLFNWTMSYAKHSDIRYHYGHIIRRTGSPDSTTNSTGTSLKGENFAEGKTKLVAWFVSHCYTQSRREKYVAILRQYIQVDIYGGCYSLRCPLNETSF